MDIMHRFHGSRPLLIDDPSLLEPRTGMVIHLLVIACSSSRYKLAPVLG